MNMFKSLSSSQRWVLVAFLASICTLFVTLFLQDSNVRTFGYVLISMCVGAYAIFSQKDADAK